MFVGLGGERLLFCKSGTKVKVNYSQKCACFWPILVTEVMEGVSCDRRGSGGVLFGSMPTILGILPNVAGQQGASCRTIQEYWQGASVAGKVLNQGKFLGRSITQFSLMRGVPLHVYCIHFSQ